MPGCKLEGLIHWK